MANRRKSIPPVSPNIPRELRPLLTALAEIIETGEGTRGNPLDRKLTVRDLTDTGLLKVNGNLSAGGGLSSGVTPPPPNMATPPTPTGLIVNGSWNGRIILSWTIPQSLYGNHAFTNIYRSETDNFANAVLVGREVGGVFTDYGREDAVDPNQSGHLPGYYYWITFTSTSDVEGPPNNPNGTYGEALPDVGYTLDILTAQINENQFVAALNTRIDKIETNESAIQTEATTRQSADDSLAQQITTVQSQLEGDIASVQQSLNTEIAATDGEITTLNAAYTLKLDVNGYVSGYTTVNDGTTSAVVWRVDQFAIGDPGSTTFYPFFYDSGVLYLDAARIRSGDIQEGQLGAITIGKISQNDGVTPITTVGGLIRAEAIDADNLSVAEAATFYGDVSSGNYSPGATGWRILQDGSVEFNEGTFNGQVEFDNITGSNKPADNADVTDYGDTRVSNDVVRGELSGVNHALSASFSSSGTLSNPALLNDGVVALSSNYWSLPENAQYITADLGLFKYIAENRVFFYNLDGRTYQYALAVSETGSGDWVFVVGAGDSSGAVSSYETSRDGGSGNAGEVFPTIDTVGRHARYLRLFMNGSTANTGNHGHEWEILGVAQGVGDPYWRRPSTTLIDGNKIFTGDAYVDTLQIKGQAVTVPVAAFTSGSIGTSSSGNGTRVQRLTINANGAPILIFFTVFVTTGYVSECKILRNGVVIYNNAAAESSYMASGSRRDDPGAGTHTYDLYIDATDGQAANRSLVALGVQR